VASLWRAVSAGACWRLPGAALLLLLAVDVVAAATMAGADVTARMSVPSYGRIALIVGLCLFFTELTAYSTRVSRFLTPDAGYLDNGSVWAMALVLLTPAGPAASAFAVLSVYSGIRSRSGGAVRPYRLLYTTATTVLACLAASQTMAATAALPHLPRGAAYALGVAVALVVFQALQQGLVGLMMYLIARPTSWRGLLPTGQQRYLETVFLIIGALTAQCVLIQPWLTPVVLAVIALVHRGALVHQLQIAATTDAKTSLLNATGWRRAAEVALQQSVRTASPVAVLLADLDHFKAINDTFGHLAGDRALAAVGECLREELRSYDAVGRFGGEEFIVLLTGVDRHGAEVNAERVRVAISRCASNGEMLVTTSVGLAHTDDATLALDTLIEAADSALYVAKAAGRDRVSSRSYA